MPLVLSGTNGISTNGTNWALQPDSSGRVRLPNQTAFYAMYPASTVVNQSTVTFTATRVNVGNAYSTSTGRFTCPVAGTYFFTAYFRMNPLPGVYVHPRFFVNGISIGDSYSIQASDGGGNDYVGTTLTALYTMAAGDYINCDLSGGNSASTSLESSQCRFMGWLVA